MSRWSDVTLILSEVLFKFTRKALIQQLPTATNLKRWGCTSDGNCPGCHHPQTNKHVLSNCGSLASLKRYSVRHNTILHVLAGSWIDTILHVLAGSWIVKGIDSVRYKLSVDLEHGQFDPIDKIFGTLRPDIVLVDNVTNCIITI